MLQNAMSYDYGNRCSDVGPYILIDTYCLYYSVMYLGRTSRKRQCFRAYRESA